jgi:hypothetical protein
MSSTAVFGVALTSVMARPTERTIPTFVKKLIRYLNAEGLQSHTHTLSHSHTLALSLSVQRINTNSTALLTIIHMHCG